MMKKLIINLCILFSPLCFGENESVLLNEKEAIKHIRGHNLFIEKKNLERKKYQRRISRESQILKEKLEKFKYDSPTMRMSLKRKEEAELKEYSNMIRKLDFRLKKEIDAREEIEILKYKKILKKEIKLFGKLQKIKIIFDIHKERLLYRAKGISPLTVKVLKQEKNIPDYTKLFILYQKKKSKIISYKKTID